jgi:hypothetical protein
MNREFGIKEQVEEDHKRLDAGDDGTATEKLDQCLIILIRKQSAVRQKER